MYYVSYAHFRKQRFMMSTRNINVNRYEDEYVIFGKFVPYIAMAIGTGLAFLLAVMIRLGIWMQDRWNDVPALESSWLATGFIFVSLIILSILAYRLFWPRKDIHPWVHWHAVATTVLVHSWLFMVVWQDMGEWMFGVPTIMLYFFGALVIVLSWCVRRWAYRGDEVHGDSDGNPFAAIGLGENTKLVKEKSYKTDTGAVYRMKLQFGKTIEDAQNKVAEIAHIIGKPRKLVHITETASGVEGQVDITVLDGDPFAAKHDWVAPDPAEIGILPITYPIEFATYDIARRGIIYLAGKDGSSSQHFLTVGMSGTGKSKAWQAIYGIALARRKVSVIYGDPAKGMQTGGPLASKLAWFATSEDECMKQIDAVMNAIVARTNRLTQEGLDHWTMDSSMNLLIFHLEEAARFAKVEELIQLLEAARSAGIVIVLSLQKATGDRLKTSARYNLGANMCFGTRSRRDAEFGLSEHARQLGATPHKWQDRYPGQFYLEAAGIDPNLAGHALKSDWINVAELQKAVDSYPENHMDETTATALGPAYAAYRDKVTSGTTDWQNLRRHQEPGNNPERDTVEWDAPMPDRSSDVTQTLTLDDIYNIDLAPDQPTNVTPTPKVHGFQTDPEDTARAVDEFEAILQDWFDNGKTVFTNKEVNGLFTSKSPAWVTRRLQLMQRNGKVEKTPEGFWRIIAL
jgi:hypothetical protein